MATPSQTVEKPAHIDDRRMRHISDEDLFAALDLARPGLEAVRAAADKGDWGAAHQAWAAYFLARTAPQSIVNVDAYAVLPPELLAARGPAISQNAKAIAEKGMDYSGKSHGRTAIYGVHYMLWMLPLLQAYLIDHDEAHIAAFVALFNQWYDTRDQVISQVVSVDAVWYTLGLAARCLVFTNALHAFRGSPLLDVNTYAKLLKSMLGAGRWLVEEHDRFRYGNWQLQGASTLYELGVVWPEFREAESWRQTAWPRMLEHLELDVYPDGGHSERAPSYHRHVLGCYARVASIAELNGQPPLQAQPRFYGMFRWLYEQTGPLGATTNCNDSQPVWVGQWAVQGAVLFGDAAFKGLAEQFGTPAEIAWTLAGLPNRPGGRTAAQVYYNLEAQPPQLGSQLLPNSKYAVMRAGLEPDDLFMTINYGPLVGHEYESHSHLDALAFICAGLGQPLAIEAGLPMTSYDDPLYKSWARTAEAHNMVVVDRADPEEHKKEADLFYWATTAVADFFEAEHRGYESRGVQSRRAILFAKGEYWIIFDALQQTGAHRFDWLLYTPQPLATGAGRWQPEAGPGLAVLPVLPAEGGRVEARQGFMAVNGPRSFDGQQDFRDVTGVSHVQETAAPEVNYLHVLYPVRGSAEAAPLQAHPVAFEGGQGQACLIDSPRGPDLYYIRPPLDRRALAEGLVQVQGWKSDARVAWLRSTAHWAVFAASRLQAGGALIFESTSELHALSLRPAGGDLLGEAEVVRQTEVTVHAERAIVEAYLNEVQMPVSSVDGQSVKLLMLCPGRYTFRITLAPA